MRSNTANVSSGRARVITGRTNFSGQSARSMSFSTPRKPGQDVAPLFSPIEPNRAQSPGREARRSFSARSSRNSVASVVGLGTNKASSDRQIDSIRPETLSSTDLSATISKQYQLGFQEGLRRSQNMRPSTSDGMLDSRTARARLKKTKAREAQAQKVQQRNEQQLNKFIKRNAEQMWEFVPDLYHTQRDEHHHLTADQWLVDKVKNHCSTTYGGDLAAMLHTFENKEVVERLSGSHNMRRILLPTVRMDVPDSHKKKNPGVYGCGYSTNRLNHEMTMNSALGQSIVLPSYLQPKSTLNGGEANYNATNGKSTLTNQTTVPSFKAGGPFAPGPKPFLG